MTFEPPGAKGRRIHILVRYRVHGLWQLDASEDSANALAPDHRRSGTLNNQPIDPIGVIRRGTSRKRNGTSNFDIWHDFVVPSLRTIAVQSPTIQKTRVNW